jgi:hypothetical protein
LVDNGQGIERHRATAADGDGDKGALMLRRRDGVCDGVVV